MSNVDLYLQQRAQLIREDRALRVDAAKLEQLTPTEAQAEYIVRKIRNEENISVWGGEHDDIPHPFPGMEFLTARSLIVQTKIFKILSKMPKGALLHVHLDATVEVSFLLQLALNHHAVHVRTASALSPQTIASALPEFRVLPESEFTSLESLTDPSYPANGWVPLKLARQNFALGGERGFDQWFQAAVTINPAEAYGTHKTVTKIWQKFSSTFAVIAGLIRFEPIFAAYVREFLLSSIEDGISYVEPRINFTSKFGSKLDGQETYSHREWLVTFGQVVQEVKDEMKRQGREDEFVGAKIIYTVVRIVTPDELEWYTEDCLALKQEFPRLLAGFDIVGDENVYMPLVDYVIPLKRFVDRQKELELDIPFFFHAGETLGDGTPADMNLIDAILLGTRRIGHGFSIVKHPKLMEICRERNIALEVCPISQTRNEILRLTSSIPMHPLAVAINHGVPVCLSSDDPAVWGSMGLSFDYYQVLVSSEINGLITLGEIAKDSLKYSTLDEGEKARAIGLWEKRWSKFVEALVLER